MKEEEYFIRKQCGNGNPFKVPEGYFEQFAPRLMNRLPEKEAKPARHPLRPTWQKTAWYAVAATVCGAMCLGIFHLKSVRHADRQTPSQTAWTAETEEPDDAYINDALDYAMVSNQEIALYLTEAY